MIHSSFAPLPRVGRRLLLGIGCGLAVLTAGADTACRAPIELPPLAREELVAVTLNSNVFAATRDDYADMAVTDDGGQPVPFVLQPQVTRRQTVVRRDCPSSAPAARKPDEQTLEVTVSLLPNVKPPTGLTIDTPLRDFQQRVRIEGSADSRTWQMLADRAVLYDLSSYIDVRQTEVSWGPTACRQFRITCFDALRDRPDELREVTRGTAGTSVRQNVRAEPFRLHSVRFWRDEVTETSPTPVTVAYPLTRDAAGPRRPAGQIVFHSSREPLTRIELATTNRLFHRSYRLYGCAEDETPANDPPGRLLACGTLMQIRFQEIARTNLAIEFPVSRCASYVLVCETGAEGAPDAELAVARAEGIKPRLIFVATPGRSYTLAFGDRLASRHNLPETAALQTLLVSPRLQIEGAVGAAIGTPAKSSPWRFWLNSSATMIGAIVAAGVLLALALFDVSRRVRKL